MMFPTMNSTSIDLRGRLFGVDVDICKDGRPSLKIADNPATCQGWSRVTLFLDWEQLAKLHSVIGEALDKKAIVEAPDGELIGLNPVAAMLGTATLSQDGLEITEGPGYAIIRPVADLIDDERR